MDLTDLLEFPPYIGFVSWCATWLVAVVVLARGRGSRQSIGVLATIYLLLGLGAVLAIGAVSGHHYWYMDVIDRNGELVPADELWLLSHAGVSIGYAALVWRSRAWPLSTPFSSAWFVLLPIVAELLLRPGHWAWLLFRDNDSSDLIVQTYACGTCEATATFASVLFAAILTMALARRRAGVSATHRA